MIKISWPVYSIRAHGWLGRYTYGRRGMVFIPYPIGRFPRYLIQSVYYSPKGWCYQIRRTWHGIVNAAMRPPISKQPNTAIQYAYKQIFAEAIHLWQEMDNPTKDVYNKWRYPVCASGYNRWIRWYLKQNLKYVPPAAGYLLQETGDGILLE